MEKPIAGALVFEFREGEKVTGSFPFPLQFTGWRQARVFYDEFPNGKPTSKVDNIRVSAPRDVASGVVYLDSLGYNLFTYYSASILPEKVAQRRRPIPDERRFPKPQRVTEAELAGIRKLQGGAAEKARPGIPEAKVNDLCDKVHALGIVRDEHGVRGPGVDGGSYYCSAVGGVRGQGRAALAGRARTQRAHHSEPRAHERPGRRGRPGLSGQQRRASNAAGWRRPSC